MGWLGVGDRSYYPIIVNLDESAVPVYMGDWKGNVIRLGRQRDLSQRISRRQLRAQVPHVTLICNEERLQLLLPQVRIGDKSTLTVVLQRELQAELPDNVTLWRLASRWVVLAVTHAIIQAVAGIVRASSTLELSCGKLYVFLSHRTYTPVHVECVATTLLCRHELRKCSRTLSLNSGLQAVLFRDPKSESIFRLPKRGPPRRNPTVSPRKSRSNHMCDISGIKWSQRQEY